jgi:hypothetical protein
MQQQTKTTTTEQQLAAALKQVTTLKAKVKAQKEAEKKMQKKLENTFVIMGSGCGGLNDNQILTLKRTDLDRFEKWNGSDNGRDLNWVCLTKEEVKPLNLKESMAWMDKHFIKHGYNWRTDEVSDSD